MNQLILKNIPSDKWSDLSSILKDYFPEAILVHPVPQSAVPTNYEDVCNFHTKFDVPMSASPVLLGLITMHFRIDFMQEELNEIDEAYSDEDLHKVADGLVDLVYVALGTAAMMGLPWQSLWNEVQRANMSKVRTPNAEASKRKNVLDVIKPEGWVAPDFTPWLGAAK